VHRGCDFPTNLGIPGSSHLDHVKFLDDCYKFCLWVCSININMEQNPKLTLSWRMSPFTRGCRARIPRLFSSVCLAIWVQCMGSIICIGLRRNDGEGMMFVYRSHFYILLNLAHNYIVNGALTQTVELEFWVDWCTHRGHANRTYHHREGGPKGPD